MPRGLLRSVLIAVMPESWVLKTTGSGFWFQTEAAMV